MTTGAVEAKKLRSFGLLVGAIFVVLGFKPSLRHLGDYTLWPVALGGALLALGAAVPVALRYPYLAWMAVGGVLGWINTRILLGVVFFLLFTPLGLLRRLLGKDSLHRRFDKGAKSYRVARPDATPTDLTRPF